MNTARPKLYLNLYWHMHQPDYRDLATNEYVLPWTYLHAIKDYSDMAYHLEINPAARVSFNFVPILLEQLEDYTQQFKQNTIRDPLLALLIKKDLENINLDQCHLIVQSCFKSHHEKMLTPFPHYQRLLQLYQLVEPMMTNDQFHYLSAQYKADLLVWYHLAWCGESLRRTNKVVQALMAKGSLFTYEERQQLYVVIGDTISNLIPRYKALMVRKQIEISTTPYYHPILPLLLDFKSTLDAMPDAPLPENTRYMGGQSRAVAHILSAKKAHQHYFGVVPRGMWPAEGAVSHAALSLMAEHGVEWAATGQGVLANSLIKSNLSVENKDDYLYQPYRVTNGKHDVLCFFRDDELSDKIGFEYAKMHSNEAVGDFIRSLERIQQANTSDQTKVVSVILDGENAWEYFPYNGFYFLSELYEALAKHPDIKMTTFSDIVDIYQAKTSKTNRLSTPGLPQVAAGSWVYGTFSTWIGSKDKNLAWDLLCEAKKTYDSVLASDSLDAEQLSACERQLAICEGSDWFWWFGDYNSSDSVASFDQLYRRNLINLYTLLGQPVPEALHKKISAGGGDADNAGTMRRGQA
ncbi:MAG: glycoside hydrolase family 57 protein [Methylotenera sp.]|nr:glycoside hydrolase family 57 protein [Methylotenera sp.]MDO9232487.1 glycoside hydrolase family 57 protein [Methylotenera sp.]MDO9388780.1 glycoside hydrolase family 57 protein [Methylotenera sp.]MDP2101708.1 glycoside hydrolase family 57 protein [Methylotenera sp.]MDP2281501.1 glycoside hydrolase family 57 protein [Methylotenera sp.]